MKYIVMECHLSYAVVLDEDGRFMKVANKNYKVGETVDDVIEMRTRSQTMDLKMIYAVVAAVACIAIVFVSAFQIGQTPYASVYVSNNSEIRIDVNRKDMVVRLVAINSQGEELIKDYTYKKKPLNLVMNELTERAVVLGYIGNGSAVKLGLEANDIKWVENHKTLLTTQLNEQLNQNTEQNMNVQIDVFDKKEESKVIEVSSEEVSSVVESVDNNTVLTNTDTVA